MGKINSAAKSAFAGVSHHSLSQIFLMSSALYHRGAFRYWWFTSRTRKRPEIWGGKIKTKFHLSELSCVFERWPVGSAGHRWVVGAHFQGTAWLVWLSGKPRFTTLWLQHLFFFWHLPSEWPCCPTCSRTILALLSYLRSVTFAQLGIIFPLQF